MKKDKKIFIGVCIFYTIIAIVMIWILIHYAK
jgi:hypothetical protein